MKKCPLIAALLAFIGIVATIHAQVPQLISYQGRVAVNGTNFDGPGQFKFALVNADGSTTYWCNDGTSTGGAQPTAAVSLTVTKGLYSVLLGDATITNMTVVPSTVFNNSDVRLRVWFNDGSTGWQQFTPDQRIAAVGYAMMAGSVADGSITSAKIASGAVGSSQIASGAVGNSQLAVGAVQATNIAPGAIGISQLASGAVSAPQNVTATSQTATPNTSYVVTGNSPVTFTLPASANVGDVVQISGAGAGWMVGSDWTAVATSQQWTGITSSSDGTKLAAMVSGGQIYISTDSGATWTARATSQPWTGIASSSDGTKLAATVSGGQIYISTDSGATWTARATSQAWTGIASSSDGTKLAATVNAYNGKIYTSTDSGATWTARATSQQWTGIASSSDGTKLAATFSGGQFYTSTDSGATWTARATNQYWGGIASSSDGTKLMATAGGGKFYTSSDSGVTWADRCFVLYSSSGVLSLSNPASSSDGTTLAACGSAIFSSTDSGVTWTPCSSSRGFISVASSSDGTKLAAVVRGGYIWIGSNNLFSVGSQGTTAAYQYVGNGRWVRITQAL